MSIKLEVSQKRIFYAVCFFLLLLIDYSKGSQVGSTWALTNNLLGVVFAVMMLGQENRQRIFGKAGLIWCAFGIVALCCAYFYWNMHQDMGVYRDAFLAAVLEVIFLGLVLIVRWEKDSLPKLFASLQKKPEDKVLFAVKVLGAYMLCWIIFGVNEALWEIQFLAIFILWYTTRFSEEDKREMILGFTDAMVVGFFVLQGLAFVLRPYDAADYRYVGMYANANQTALFYGLVWIALMIKLFYFRKENAKLWKRIASFMLSGGVLGFMLLTGCKSGLIAVFILLALYVLFADFVVLKKKAKQMVGRILLYGLLVCVALPICYSAARYLPPIFHHPIWYEGEYSEDKVHSFDPWNSDKYVSFEEATGSLTERIKPFLKMLQVEAKSKYKKNGITIGDKFYSFKDPYTQANESTLGRLAIWYYYFEKGNWIGHTDDKGHKVGIRIGKHQPYIWHGQNMFLQYWFYYGYPAAVCFALAGVLVLGASLKRFLKGNDSAIIVLLCFGLFLIFGLFEAVWYPGQMIFTLAFMTPVFLQKERKNELSEES